MNDSAGDRIGEALLAIFISITFLLVFSILCSYKYYQQYKAYLFVLGILFSLPLICLGLYLIQCGGEIATIGWIFFIPYSINITLLTSSKLSNKNYEK
jgi:hypothetical protein